MIRKWIVERLGGYYPPVDKNEVLTERVAVLFSTVSEKDFFSFKNGVWYIKGRALTEAEVGQLQNEARLIENMFLWKSILKEVEYHSYRNGFLKAKDETDLIGGKMMLYCMDIIKTKLKNLSS